MFSNPKHVLCTNEIIWHVSQVWWLPMALKLSSILYFIRAPSCPWSEIYTFLVYTWYWRFINANILIPEGSKLFMLWKKRLTVQPVSEENILGRWLSLFAVRHTLVTPTDQSWEPCRNACGLRDGDFFFLQNETEAERRENVSERREIWRFQEGGLKMDVKGRAGQKNSLHGVKSHEGVREVWVRKHVV